MCGLKSTEKNSEFQMGIERTTFCTDNSVVRRSIVD